MANFLENVIEKLIGDGIITETELQQRIEEAKEQSPVVALQEENAELMFQNAMQDFSITQLQNENAELMFEVAMLKMGGNV